RDDLCTHERCYRRGGSHAAPPCPVATLPLGHPMLTLEGTAAAKPSLFIVDAMNFLFRALDALRRLKTTKRTHTGAIYGLCQMILKIQRDQKRTRLCVAYDAPCEKFRK